jgi:hypothetical protein
VREVELASAPGLLGVGGCIARPTPAVAVRVHEARHDPALDQLLWRESTWTSRCNVTDQTAPHREYGAFHHSIRRHDPGTLQAALLPGQLGQAATRNPTLPEEESGVLPIRAEVRYRRQ